MEGANQLSDNAPEKSPNIPIATLIARKSAISVFYGPESTTVTLDRRRNIWKLHLAEKDVEDFGRAIADSRTLERLIIFAEVELNHVREGLKVNTSIKTLEVSSVQDHTVSNMALGCIGDILQHNRNLTDLNLISWEDHRFTTPDNFDTFLDGLRKCTSLSCLSMPSIIYRQDHMATFIDVIQKHPKISLSNLKFPSFGVSTEGMKSLALLLKAKFIGNALAIIDRKSCDVSDLVPVFEALKENTSVTKLSLHLKRMRDKPIHPKLYSRNKCPQMTVEECEALAEALKVNNTLTILDVQNNELGSERMSIILNGLQHNKSITQLDFSENNNLDDGIAPSLAKVLESNKSLTELHLGDVQQTTKITDEGCKLIGPALKKNKSITKMMFYKTPFGPEGCKYIAEGLKFNKTLKRLFLHCDIEDAGSIYLGEALKKNQCLIGLDVNWYIMKGKGYNAFVDALEQNKSLQFFERNLSQEAMPVYNAKREIVKMALENNKQYRKDVIVTTIVTLIQLARSDVLRLLPLEIWIRIFKNISCGGIPNFKYIAEYILVHADVRDLKSLCKLKIRRINCKSRLVDK